METVLGFDAIAFWIVATGVLVSVSGALLGNFLVLRKMSLMGDAISRAVLPGMALSFVITQSRAPYAMMIGALLAGLVTVVLTELIRKYAAVAEDSAMGVVFTSMFAVGVVMIALVASQVDLDPGCVLYGILESAALDTVMIGNLDIPRVTLTMGGTLFFILVFVVVFWKELKIVSFDPHLATTLGINANVIHYLLMAMVAIYTVAAFEAVGSILVVAMLIVPSAAAYLLTDRMVRMVLFSVGIGVLTAFFGRWGALVYETPVAGMMAVVAGGFFLLAVLFAPRHGYLARLVFQARVGLRIVREDLAGMLFRWHELSPDDPMEIGEAVDAVGGGVLPRVALAQLQRQGKVLRRNGGVELSQRGLAEGMGIVRGHRLWESFLDRHFLLPKDHLHEPAHRIEHFLDERLKQGIASDMDHPKTDPHGKPIDSGDSLPAHD